MTALNIFVRCAVLPIMAALALATLIGQAAPTVALLVGLPLVCAAGAWGSIRFAKEYRNAWR